MSSKTLNATKTFACTGLGAVVATGMFLFFTASVRGDDPLLPGSRAGLLLLPK
jgi:hypothetical protein